MPRHYWINQCTKLILALLMITPKSGWNGSIWGDYYINMFDSNTLNNGGNY